MENAKREGKDEDAQRGFTGYVLMFDEQGAIRKKEVATRYSNMAFSQPWMM